MTRFLIFFSLLLGLSLVQAEGLIVDEALTVDVPVAGDISIDFADDDAIEPKPSEFEIVSFMLMSNRLGERWTTLTLRNTSIHQRLLDKEHIVAVFADGERRYPVKLEEKFSGKEQVTKVVNFGLSKFPILKVYVRQQ